MGDGGVCALHGAFRGVRCPACWREDANNRPEPYEDRIRRLYEHVGREISRSHSVACVPSFRNAGQRLGNGRK